MATYVVKHDVLFTSDKDGVTHPHEKGSKVELEGEQADRMLEFGAVEAEADAKKADSEGTEPVAKRQPRAPKE